MSVKVGLRLGCFVIAVIVVVLSVLAVGFSMYAIYVLSNHVQLLGTTKLMPIKVLGLMTLMLVAVVAFGCGYFMVVESRLHPGSRRLPKATRKVKFAAIAVLGGGIVCVVLGIAGIAMIKKVHSQSEQYFKSLTKAYKANAKSDMETATVESINRFQQDKGCCGYSGPEDWLDHNNTRGTPPFSCCDPRAYICRAGRQDRRCAKNPERPRCGLHGIGCHSKLDYLMNSNLQPPAILTTIIGFGTILLGILALVYAMQSQPVAGEPGPEIDEADLPDDTANGPKTEPVNQEAASSDVIPEADPGVQPSVPSPLAEPAPEQPPVQPPPPRQPPQAGTQPQPTTPAPTSSPKLPMLSSSLQGPPPLPSSRAQLQPPSKPPPPGRRKSDSESSWTTYTSRRSTHRP